MTCEETQKAFSLYLDGRLSEGARFAADEHLGDCPVCRLRLDETRAIVRGLAMLGRPAPPPDLTASISDALMIERAARTPASSEPLAIRIFQWLEPHLMPYTVGAFASLLLFFAVSGALARRMTTLRDLADESRVTAGIATPAVEEGGFDVTRPVSLEGYVAKRTAFATESPSLNPRGALAALAWTPSKGRPDDDDMIVIADVYSNGSASLAAVVEPPRNPRMLDELQDALRKNPAFVPASLDRRPQTMRVVFVLQKMNVEERSF